jgi:hypothetical protein
MKIAEILIIVLASLFVIYVFGKRIYKIIHHMPSDTCEECHTNMKNAVKRMKKNALKKKKRALKEASINKENNSL